MRRRGTVIMKKALVGLVLLSDVFAAFADSGFQNPADFFNEKIEFTVAGYEGLEILKDFPVLIRLSSAIEGFDYGRCHQDTIRFMDGDGNLLPFEIDTWNAAGTSYIWVSVPELKGRDTTVVMGYGGDGSECNLVTDNVWTLAGYKSVWHMNIAGIDTADSVAGYSASVINSNDYCGAAMGLIGGDYFCHDNKLKPHGLSVPAAGNDGFRTGTANVLTVSSWVRQISTNTGSTTEGYPNVGWGTWGNCGVVLHTGANNGQKGTGMEIGLEGSKGSSAFTVRDSVNNHTHDFVDIYDGEWHYLVVRYDDGNITAAVDGISRDSFTGVYTNPGNESTYLGTRNADNRDCTWTGDLDELRFRDAASSDDWLAAEYANVTDPGFVTNSGAEQMDPGKELPTVVKLMIPTQAHMSLVSVTCDGLDAMQDETGAWSVLSGSSVTATFIAATGYELTGNPVEVTVGPDAEQTLTVFPTATAIVLPDDGVTLTKISEYGFDVDGCGGIAYSGKDNLFYVLQDHSTDSFAKVHPLTLGIDTATGAITSQTLGAPFTPGSNRDSEGIVYDSASGKLWISDEITPAIAEFGLDGVASGRTAPVPDIIREKVREGTSLESLALSPDGLTMWTANEQALSCDGEVSSGNDTVQTVIRLVRFSRVSPDSEWIQNGQWAYACDRCAGTSYAQSGVSGLCVLPDGSLLVLEREVSITSWGRCRIYRVTSYALDRATDVSSITSLADAAYTGVFKGSPLVEFKGAFLNIIVYEGITLGPKLNDGSYSVYLVSDGGETKSVSFVTAKTVDRICALRLSGLVESGGEPEEWDVAGATGGITGFDNGNGGRCVTFKKVALTGGRLKVDFDAGKVVGDGQKFVLVCKDSLTSTKTFNIEATLICNGDKKGTLETEALAELTGKQQLFILGIGAVE